MGDFQYGLGNTSHSNLQSWLMFWGNDMLTHHKYQLSNN